MLSFFSSRTARTLTVLAMVAGFPLFVFSATPATSPAPAVSTNAWGIALSKIEGKESVYVLGDGRARVSANGQFTTLRYDVDSASLQAKEKFTTSTEDRALAVIGDAQGGAYVAGVNCDGETGRVFIRTMKYNSQLTRQWSRTEPLSGITCRGEETLSRSVASLALSPDASTLFVAGTIGDGGPLGIYKYHASTGESFQGTWPVIHAALKFTATTVAVESSGNFVVVAGPVGVASTRAGTAGGKVEAVKFSVRDGSMQPGWPKIESWKSSSDVALRRITPLASGLMAVGFERDQTGACRIAQYGATNAGKEAWSVVTPSEFSCRDVFVDERFVYALGERRDNTTAVSVVRLYDLEGAYLRDIQLKPSLAVATLREIKK